jgi:hypothetical protein
VRFVVSADAPSKPEPTDEEILAWVRDRYGERFAKSVRDGIEDPASPGFAAAVRRSLIREMTR